MKALRHRTVHFDVDVLDPKRSGPVLVNNPDATADQGESLMDQWASGAHEPHAQGSDVKRYQYDTHARRRAHLGS